MTGAMPVFAACLILAHLKDQQAMKINEFQLRKELGALEQMIAALSVDLARQCGRGRKTSSQNQLIEQMGEALTELRRRRGQRKFLLKALERNKRRSH
jgi:hypothetical protein